MKKTCDLYNTIFDKIHRYGDDIFKLFVRLYVAYAFFLAGWSKAQSWDSTLFLFEAEYQVPLLPFEFAAYLGTGIELVLPVLLALGILTRLVAFGLFIFNAVAVYSYPILWENSTAIVYPFLWNTAFWDHKLWGAMLLVTIIYGQGKIALDTLFCRRMSRSGV